MRLHRITLRNFRGTEDRTVVFGEGVTIVQGPNEAGKSSLMEGLRLLRHYKSSSTHSAIRAVKPVNRDEGPQVEAEFTIGPHRIRYAKQWLKGQRTILEVHGDRAESLTGESAHNRFLAILQEHADDQLLEALEIGQGGSLSQAQLVTLPSLRRALDDASLPVTDSDTLLTAVEEEYQRYFTATGKPTGEYLKAERELEELRARTDEASALSKELDDLTAKHERLRREREEVQGRLREARDDLAAQNEKNRRLNEIRDRVTTVGQQVDLAQTAARRAEQALNDREEIVAAVHAAREAVEGARRDDEEAQIGKAEAETRLLESRGEVDKAEAAATQLRNRIGQAEEASRRQQAAEELGGLTKRLERLSGAEEVVARAARRCEEGRVDPGLVKQLEEAEVACRILQGRLEMAAASYRLEVSGEVLLDGTPLPKGPSGPTPISHLVRIEVPGQLHLEIAPDADVAELDREFRATQGKRTALLEELGVASIEEARQRAAGFVRLTSDKEAAEVEVRVLLAGESRAGLEARAEMLRGIVSRSEPRDDDVAASLATLREAAEQAEQRLREATAAQQAAQDRFTAMLETAITAAATLDALASRADEEAQRLEAARERQGDDEVEADRLACLTRVEELAVALAEAERELTDSDADGVQLQAANVAALVERLEREGAELEGELLRIETLLADRMASGPYDILTRARSDLDALSARQAARHRAARAAALLWETLRRHRDNAQLRYVAPFKERIEALGRPIFGPGLEVGVSPDLRLESRTLDGVTVAFDSLSVGAQEQLALIGRLACAELVDPGQGAPVVIDDALGFADPERIRAFAAVLNDVGSRAQIIILTCQPERFGHIGAAGVVRV